MALLRVWLIVAIAGAASAIPGVALSEPASGGPGGSGQRPYAQRAVVNQAAADRVFDQLQLTEQQRQRCTAIVRGGYAANRQLRDEARDSWHELMELLRSPAASVHEALVKQREVAQLQESLAEKRLLTWFAMRQILTPEQLVKLSSLSLDPAIGLEDPHAEQGDPTTRHDAERQQGR